MAQNSKIEWTTHTFNPWRGCQKVAAGCQSCYAESSIFATCGRETRDGCTIQRVATSRSFPRIFASASSQPFPPPACREFTTITRNYALSSILRAVDLFCGAGGTSQGAKQSGAAKVVCAVNHWNVACQTHSANFPDCRHINSRLDQVNPSECSKIDLLFASPECTGHSRARGGRPTSDQKRSGAWDVMRWIEFHRPSHIVIENVMEFRDWGPVDPKTGKPLPKFKGRFFDAWINSISAAGYRVDHQLLNAADFGAATSRNRLFVIARKGNRNPVFPSVTHSAKSGGELPGMKMSPWRPAYEIIDWSIPCKSVFARPVPLKDNTLFRIEAGLRKFVEPFVVLLRNNSTANCIWQPLNAITAGGRHHGIAVPFLYQLNGLGAGRSKSVGTPLPTIVAARENHGVSVPFLSAFHCGPDGDRRNYPLTESVPTLDTSNRFGLAMPFLFATNHSDTGNKNGRSSRIEMPIAAATSKRGQAIAVPFVVTYFKNGKPYPVSVPLGTITTHDRCGLAMAIIETCGSIEPRTEGERRLLATMKELSVADVGFRMLANQELSLAQGFPSDYIFHGNKGDVTRQIGNSVAPDVAEAIVRELSSAA